MPAPTGRSGASANCRLLAEAGSMPLSRYKPAIDAAARRLDAGGSKGADDTRSLAEEAPIALSFNGVTHAVMLATPAYLDDFGRGFALSEGIVESSGEILELDIRAHPEGV